MRCLSSTVCFTIFCVLGTSWELVVSAAEYCWQDLSEGLGKQQAGSLEGAPSIALSAKGTLWLTWAEGDAIQVRKRERGEWRVIPGPGSEIVSGHPPRISIDMQDNPYLLWTGSDDSQSNAYVSRWNGSGWERLGRLLSAYPGATTNAGEAVMVLNGQGLPVVTWQEAEGNGPRSLHAVRWDGTQWRPLGKKPIVTNIDLYSLEPDLTIDRAGTIWVLWLSGTRERSYIRVARWQGSKWIEMPGLGLSKSQRFRMPHLAMVDQRSILVAWLDRDSEKGSSLAAAQWNGKRWVKTSPPESADESTSAAGHPSMVAAENGAVFLAWEEKDASGFSVAYVQTLIGNRWEPLLGKVHLNAGYSDVHSPTIVSGRDHDFYLAWDEPDQRQGHIRVIHAGRCASGMKPSPFPSLVPIDSFWPKTVDDAVMDILEKLTAESKVTLLQTRRENLGAFNLSWGMGIRNAYGLWRGNTALLESCGNKEMEPDQCSAIIIKNVWDRVHEKNRTQEIRN